MSKVAVRADSHSAVTPVAVQRCYFVQIVLLDDGTPRWPERRKGKISCAPELKMSPSEG